MNSDYSLIMSTFPDKESAKKTVKLLVEQQLAACVQTLPIESVYLWKDEICEDNEIMLLIKTKAYLFDMIATIIKDVHSYEVPEIVQIPIDRGLPEYLQWIDECVEGSEG
jgi:periplasmic divalent cation tolerance protein